MATQPNAQEYHDRWCVLIVYQTPTPMDVKSTRNPAVKPAMTVDTMKRWRQEWTQASASASFSGDSTCRE